MTTKSASPGIVRRAGETRAENRAPPSAPSRTRARNRGTCRWHGRSGASSGRPGCGGRRRRASAPAGMPRRIAIFSMRWVLALPSLPMLPPNTLKSCDRIATGRPSIRAVPVTTPSAGDFSLGCGVPASGSADASAPISSNVPGSTSRSIRVRAERRPRSASRFMASGRAASISVARSASIAARICRSPASGWCVMVSPSGTGMTSPARPFTMT